ncbi:MAG: hypothetical protein AABW72_01520 [archaeon]
MVIKLIIRSLLKRIDSIVVWATEPKEKEMNEVFKDEFVDKKVKKIYAVWDFVRFKKDTQADHLSKVVGFDEWISMEEIRRRIKVVVGIEYLNERSLYPYIKTMVDVGFFEASSVGGIRKWKKNEFLFELVDEIRDELRAKEPQKKKIKLISESN